MRIARMPKMRANRSIVRAWIVGGRQLSRLRLDESA